MNHFTISANEQGSTEEQELLPLKKSESETPLDDPRPRSFVLSTTVAFSMFAVVVLVASVALAVACVVWRRSKQTDKLFD